MTVPADRFHRRSFFGVAAVGLLGLTVAGCGKDDGGTTATRASGGQDPPPALSGADPPVVAIAMKDISFQPEVATVEVGQKVVWTNREAVQHDVRALQGASFHSKLFGEGGTFAFTPQQPGTVRYDCSVHPGMTGTLKVVAA